MDLLLKNKKIENVEKKLLVFCIFDEASSYDVEEPDNFDKITKEDIDVINKAMGARTKWEVWEPLSDLSLEEIDVGWDLLEMSDAHWHQAQNVVADVFIEFLKSPGIGVSVLTKVLHKKRPRFIPVCDSVVVEELFKKSWDTKDAWTAVRCMEEFRSIGKSNGSVLGQIGNYLTKRFFDVYYPGKSLTPLRMIEITVWLDNTKRYQAYFAKLNSLNWNL